jgi:hypothetical protein
MPRHMCLNILIIYGGFKCKINLKIRNYKTLEEEIEDLGLNVTSILAQEEFIILYQTK